MRSRRQNAGLKSHVLGQVQSAILKRGLTVLKPQGRLLYSTCCMSPVENEAVVAAALEKWLANFHASCWVATVFFKFQSFRWRKGWAPGKFVCFRWRPGAMRRA